MTAQLHRTGLLALALLAFALVLPASAAAQAIEGRITDAADGAPIVGAAVVVLDEAASPIGTTATDDGGNFRLDVPAAGSYLIVVQIEGFASQTSSPLTVVDGETLSYDLSMTRQQIGGGGGGANEMDDATFIQQYIAELCQGTFIPGIHGILFGAVRNAGSGEALPGIQVTVRWDERTGFGQQARTTRSDSSGFWYVCDVPSGPQVLVRAQATEADTEGETQRVQVQAGTMRNLDVEIALSDPSQNGNVIGVVRDVDTDRPVIGAVVRLREAGRSTTTNSRGLFVLNEVPAGLEVIEVEVLGYEDIVRPLQIYGGRSQQIEVLASSQPFELDPILVTVRSRTWFSDRAGLESRMAIGAGHFILREDLEDRPGATTLGDVLRDVPGVRVRRQGGGINGQYIVQLRGAANMANEACTPNIFVDAVPLGRDSGLFSDILSFDIEVVEVYRGASEVPGEYSGGDSRCGVVAVWTRRGIGLGG